MSLKAGLFLTQNEPEGKGECMLGIDHQHAGWRETEPGADPGISEASEELHFEGKRRAEVYDWITRLLRQQGYREQGKVVRGLLRRYLSKMTGRSRAQVTRLIGRYLKHSEVK